MSNATNPLSRGYAAIITALEAFAPLMAVVRLGNVQTLQTPGYRPRTNVGAGDRVELKLLERRVKAKPITQNSMSTVIECLYPLEIASGSMGIDTANLATVLVIQALTQSGPFLGIPDIVTKWEWVDASMIAKDPAAGRPDWKVTGGVTVLFGLGRKTFLQTQFT